MTRNIFKCTRRRFGNLHCAFMKLDKDPKTGRLEEQGCVMKFKDEYRLYPEFDSNGNVIRNNVLTSDPFPLGINVIWENDTANENGLTFSFRRNRAEEYNFHPLYFIEEINEPVVTGLLGDDHVSYAFGSTNVSLSPGGWKEQKILGLQRVEDCMMGIYGQFDKVEKLVVPRCLRDYTGEIKNWINYTPIPNSQKRKTFFVCDESDTNIAKFCMKKFGKTSVAAAIYQILIAIKHGEYINLWEALINNGLSSAHVRAFMNEVSTKSKSTIYSNMNLQKYYYYWKALGRMGLSEEKVYLYRCNLLNYVLNYPPLKRLNLDKPPIVMSGNKMFYPPNKRYWWVVMMIENALAESKAKKRPYLTNNKIKWFKKFVDETKNSNSSLLSETRFLNPAVETFCSIVEKKNSPGWKRQARVFARILLAGKRWTIPEVKVTWTYFQKAYNARKPERFWQYVETVMTSAQDEITDILHEAGIYEENMVFTQQRAFSHHLLEARKSRTSFAVEAPKLMERWVTITPKYRNNELMEDRDNIEYTDIFWAQLARVWPKQKTRIENISQIIHEHFSELPVDEIKALSEMYQDEMNENVLIGRSISKDDIGKNGQLVIEDIDGNIETGGNEWHDSESAE